MNLTLTPFTNLVVLAQAAPSPGGGGLVQFLPIVFMFAAMYFFIIAPQRKKQKEHDKMVSELKSGEEVVTNGGIYGTITNVKDDRFVLKIADNTKIEVTKTCIAMVLGKGAKT